MKNSRIAKLIGIGLLALGMFGNVFGQSTHQVSQGITGNNLAPGSPSGSYAVSDFESINPFSGKPNFSLPLLKVGGRGNAGYSMNLSIQKNWMIQHEVYDPNIYLPHAEQYFIDHRYQPMEQSDELRSIGIDISTQMGVMKGTRLGTNRNIRLCGNRPCFDETLTRLSFITPDGTEIEFRDVLTGGKAKLLTLGNTINYSRGTIWVSVDGSNARFISNTDIYDEKWKDSQGLFLPSGILTLANGTKYTIQAGKATEIKDINGNRVELGKDSLGREITVTEALNPSPNIHRDKVINIKGINGTPRTIKIRYSFLETRLSSGFTLEDLWGLFPGVPTPNGQSGITYNPEVVSFVEFPNGKSYEFKYNKYGELTETILPTGAKIEYVWQASAGVYGQVTEIQPPSGTPPDDKLDFRVYRRVVKRRIYESNQLKNETVYGVPAADNSVTVETYANENGVLVLNSKSRHYYFGNPLSNVINPDARRPTEDPDILEGKEFKTESYAPNETTPRSKTETEWENPNVPNGPILRPARIKSTTSSIREGANMLTSKTVYGYDDTNLYGNKTDEWVYDYGVGNTVGRLLKHIQTGYLKINPANGLDYASDSIRMGSLPNWNKVFDVAVNGTEQLISHAETVYDEPQYLVADSGTLSGTAANMWQSSPLIFRGEPTTSRVWNNDTQTWIESKTQYDQYGNVRKVTDAIGNVAETIYSAEYACAYPTHVITPAPDPTNTNGTDQKSHSYTTYDFTTGLPLTVTDDFGQTIRTEYNDLLLRPTKVLGVNVNIPITETIYDDTNLTVKVRKQIDETNWDEATSYADSLGRTTKTQAKDSQGDVVVETKYDNLGRVEKTSNPYRVGDVKYWSKPRYDELNRVVETFAPAIEGQVGASLGITEFGISTVQDFVGTFTIATDASGRKARSITNSLGQLSRIDEPTGNNDLGTIDAPLQPTFYKYNPQGKMVKVSQGVQNRYFLYDFLGRLIRVRQPEQEVNATLDKTDLVTNNNQWTAAMEYDVVGNLKKTTDAEGKQITNDYDKAGRVTKRSYSNADTPTVFYYYDGFGLATPPPTTGNFAKGKLTKVMSSISTTQYTSFDNFGRTLNSQQITDGQTYESKYKYDFGGRLVEQTYPSGKVVRNFFESDGDLARITGQGKVYASDFAYTATGSYDRLKLGNGRWESWKYNSRLQLTEIALGTQPTDGSLWKQNYEFGEIDANGNVNTSKNTGNIAKLTNSFNGLAQPFVQTFKYDLLNRITEAKELNNGTTTWQQAWNYDRFGNRTSFNSQAIGQTAITTTPNIDPNTNRFVSGVQYDKAGNIVQDSVNGQLRTFVFNGDNKQVQVKDASGNPIGTYYYNGEGKRVKKSTASETTIFAYDASGKLVAEYSTAPPPPNPTVSYTATDTLGSPRVITDKQGNVTSRRDFLPFGEELIPDANYRKTAFKYGYGSDNVRKRFTGYEKDQETGLDFAEARYYNNIHGRFTAVDPLLASGKSGNPQSFNRYAYTMNQPLSMTDKTGLQTEGADDVIDGGTSYALSADWIKKLGAEVYNTISSYLDQGFTPTQAFSIGKFQVTQTTNTAGLRTVREFANRAEKVDSVMQYEPSGIYNTASEAIKLDTGRGSKTQFALKSGEMVFNMVTLPMGGGFKKQAAKEGFSFAAKEGGEVGAKKLFTFFHGTDVKSGLNFLNGEGLNAIKAASSKIDGSAGFFLATNSSDAMFFAARRSPGTVLQYNLTGNAMRELSATSIFRTIPSGATSTFVGSELIIPHTSFRTFNNLRRAGDITVTPFRF
jgi:RHS repeat-associated protein